LKLQEYPILYQASDSSAIKSEQRYFRLVKIKIALLLITTGIASFAWKQEPSTRTLVATVSAIVLFLLMAHNAITDTKKFDRSWFSSRAIAESVKKESWSFMMKVEPYDDPVSDSVAENRFLERLYEILHRQPSVCSELASYSEGGSQITEDMRQIRRKALEDRRAYYVQNRIRDQRIWYTSKARWNQAQESRWFRITWILQISAAIFAVVIIGLLDPIVNPVGILATAGAGVLTWTNAQAYRELSQSYGLVAQELALLEEKGKKASTEKELAEIVLEVEQTISREHTIWLTKRVEPS